MAQTSISERLAVTRRRQGRAIAGLSLVEEPAHPPSESLSEWVPQLQVGSRSMALRERAGQVKEFEALLPSVAAHYGYSESDIRHVRGVAMANTAAGEMELALCVRQWRLDAVTFRFDDQLPAGVGRRARTQFRQDIMGMTHDEGGYPYLSSALDWEPEDLVA